MNLKEILKSQGLTDEQVTKITDEMKANKIFTANEENLDIRYGKLKGDFDNLTAQHKESTTLIEQLKASAKGNEGLQTKITNYEAEITRLQDELKKSQLDAAIKVALLESKATDVDYMTFKLKEKGELELDENGKIKGIDDKLAGLKTQFPTQFESATTTTKVVEVPLPKTEGNNGGMTKSEFLRKPYAERAAYAAQNPEAYKTLMSDK